MSTDYTFNLDRLHSFHSLYSFPDLIVKPLLVVRLTKKQTIFLKRSLIHANNIQDIVQQISTYREKQKIFIRLSTRSAKDAIIPWDSNDVNLILCRFVCSGRIQEDIEESIRRKKNLSLIVLPFVTFGTEYRSFVYQGKYIMTRSDKGVVTKDPKNPFEKVANLLIQIYGTEKDFVFDMGENVETGKLQLIETNQLDETTDQYEDETPPNFI